MFRHRKTLPTAWRQAAFAALTLVLLLPVPLWATYTLGTWAMVNNPDGWSFSSSSNNLDLAITPMDGGIVSGTRTFVFYAPVSGSSLSTTATTSNFNAFAVAA